MESSQATKFSLLDVEWEYSSLHTKKRIISLTKNKSRLTSAELEDELNDTRINKDKDHDSVLSWIWSKYLYRLSESQCQNFEEINVSNQKLYCLR